MMRVLHVLHAEASHLMARQQPELQIVLKQSPRIGPTEILPTSPANSFWMVLMEVASALGPSTGPCTLQHALLDLTHSF